MNNFIQMLIKRKYVLLSIGVILFMIVGLILFNKRENPTSVTTMQPSPTETDTATTITKRVTPLPTVESTAVTKWATYRGTMFTMQYPPDWIVKSYPISTSDLALVIKPSVLPQGINYPQFNLQTQVYSDEAMQNKEGILQGFNMTKSEYKVGEDTAIKYSGTIPFKTVGNQIVEQPIQDTSILLKRGNTLYLFKYEYEGPTPNTSLDDYFNDFIASFKTN